MGVYVTAEITANIENGFYMLLNKFRAEKDDGKARAIIKEIRQSMNRSALSSFKEGQSFDVSKEHITLLAYQIEKQQNLAKCL